MKSIIIIAALLAAQISFAQTMEEWTAQIKTQRKYLIEQIAAFSVYNAKQSSANKSNYHQLQLIDEKKQADQTQHTRYLASLKVCSESIRTAVLASKLLRSLSVAGEFVKAQEFLDKLAFIHSDEKVYLTNRLNKIHESAKQDLVDLKTLLGSGITFTDGTSRLDRGFQNLSVLQQHLQDMLVCLSNAKVLNNDRSHELSQLKLLRLNNDK